MINIHMHVDSDDYIVIAKYAADGFDWIDEVSTYEKRLNLIEFSLAVSEVFIQMCTGQVKGEF